MLRFIVRKIILINIVIHDAMALADIIPTLYQKCKSYQIGYGSLSHFFLLQHSTILLRILAAPNKAVFCNSDVLVVFLSFSSHGPNILLTAFRVPTITGTTSKHPILHSFLIFLFSSWYFTTFSLFSLSTLSSQG